MSRSFGEMLKSYRKEHGLSLDQVAVAIKINSSILEKIENENLEELPKIVFTRGLIRTYCKYLEIDEIPVLESFDEQTDYVSAKAKRIDLSEDNHPKTPLFITFSRTFIPLLIIVTLVAAGYGIFFITQKYKKEISTVVTKNIQAIHKAGGGTKMNKEEILVDGNEIKDLSDGDTGSNTEVSDPLLKPQAAKTNNKDSDNLKANPKKEALVNTVTTETNIDPKQITQRITLEPLAKTLVQIQLDNENVQKIILRPDVNRTFQAKKSIKLKISDAGAVNIIHNRKDIGVPGIFGQSIELQFPQE